MTAKDKPQALELIVGLGNPGPKYTETRHNAGFWFLDKLAERYHSSFRAESRFSGELCKIRISSREILLLKPATFMNASGRSVSAVANYFKIDTPQILVVHDELDLPPGSVRIKSAGGHGGHNGLRDISAHQGKEFWRLRLGIGHPGHKDGVSDYVLKRASKNDQELIDDAIDDSLSEFESIADAQMNQAMQILHSR